MDYQIKETLSGFGLGLICYGVFVEAVGFFFSSNLMSYSLGLLFGLAVSVFLIFHMTVTLGTALDRTPEQAMKYVRRKSILRLVIMMAAMLLGLLVKQMNFITVVLGMLGLKIGALIAPFFLKRLYPSQYGPADPEEE